MQAETARMAALVQFCKFRLMFPELSLLGFFALPPGKAGAKSLKKAGRCL
jgi:hypothetical protein